MPDESRTVLFMIDEAANIGDMRAITDGVALFRGMGVRFFFIFQSLAQLKQCYGEKAASILENIDTQIYFGTNHPDTAEAISKRIGDMTYRVESGNTGESTSNPTGNASPTQGGSVSNSRSVTVSEIARRLIKPEEVLTLPEDEAIIFHRNNFVIVTRLLKYFNSREFCKKSGEWQARPQVGLGVRAAAASLGVLAGSLLLAFTATRAEGWRPSPLADVAASRAAARHPLRPNAARPSVLAKPPTWARSRQPLAPPPPPATGDDDVFTYLGTQPPSPAERIDRPAPDRGFNGLPARLIPPNQRTGFGRPTPANRPSVQTRVGFPYP